VRDDLPRLLHDWQDFDAVMHDMARALGLLSAMPPGYLPPKHVYWSANPIGDFLSRVIANLVELGVLEHDEESDRFRWSPNYSVETLIERLTRDEKRGPTRRQSQRPRLALRQRSCLGCQPRSWLIFDVGQNTFPMKFQIILIGICACLLSARTTPQYNYRPVAQ
jgi:hypothetical protein